MSEVVRDPNGVFECPRCGRPVLYKGRGRRPVWCSARCRVEASIERRGNRMVGIEPRVVTVVSPTQQLAESAQDELRRIQANLSEDAVTAMVAEHPSLLARTLERLRNGANSTTEGQRRFLAERLIEAAQDLAPRRRRGPAILVRGGPGRGAGRGARWSGRPCWTNLRPSSATTSSTAEICPSLTNPFTASPSDTSDGAVSERLTGWLKSRSLGSFATVDAIAALPRSVRGLETGAADVWWPLGRRPPPASHRMPRLSGTCPPDTPGDRLGSSS